MSDNSLAQTLFVMPWHDPVVEAVGYDARGPYVELFWLGILGPTACDFASTDTPHFA